MADRHWRGGRRPSRLALAALAGVWALLCLPAAHAANPPSRDDTVFTTGRLPTVVVGQPNFTSGAGGIGSNQLSLISAAATSGAGIRASEYRTGLAFDFSVGYMRLWVADTFNNRVLRYDIGERLIKGTLTNQPGYDAALTGFNAPTGLAFDGNGYLWVCDTNNHRVLRFSNLSSGAIPDVTLGGTQGSAANQLYKPVDLAFDASGNLWVADMNNNRVVRFPAGQLFTGGSADTVLGQQAFGRRAAWDPSRGCVPPHPGVALADDCVSYQGSLHYPLAVAFDSNGYLWVADHESNRVLRFSSLLTAANADIVLGQASYTADEPNSPEGSGCAADTVCTHNAAPAPSNTNLIFPHGVFFDGEKNLWVADAMNVRSVKFAAGGTFVSNMGWSWVFGQTVTNTRDAGTSNSAFAGPTATVTDPLGNLWVADTLNNRVLLYETQAFNAGGTTSLGIKLGYNYNLSGTNNFGCQLDTTQSFNSANLRTSGNVITGLSNYTFSSPALLSNATYYLQCQPNAGSYRILDSTVTTVVIPGNPSFSGVGFNTMTVSFSGVTNSTWTSYELSLSADSGFSSGLQVVVTTGTSYIFSGLVPNHRYYARVRAYGWLGSAYGYTGYSATTDRATLATLNTFAKLLPTPDPSASDWVGQQKLTYTGSSGDNNATTYLYRIDGGPSYAFNGSESVWSAGAASGLVAYWPFDEGSGTTATDASGNGNNGAINGAGYTNGIAGTALSFNGLNSYASVSNTAFLPVGNQPRTMSGWIKTSGFLPGRMCYFGYGGAATDLAFDMCSGIFSDGKVYFINYGDDLAGSALVADGNWHHVAVTYDGSIEKLYVDGVLNVQAAKSLNTTNVGVYPFVVGRQSYPDGSVFHYANGLVDEVRVYNRALSATEVAAEAAVPGNLTVSMTASGTWYFHIAARNGDLVISTNTDLGPYLYDSNANPPIVNSGSFRHFNATGAALTTSEWNNLSNASFTLTAQDTPPLSGMNLTGFNLGASASVAAHWHLDEGAGRSAPDASANGNHGFAAGTLSYGTGQFGTAAFFNGTSDAFAVAHSASLKPAAQISFEVWIRPNDVSTKRTLYRKEDGSDRHLLRFTDSTTCGFGSPCLGFGLSTGGSYAEFFVPITVSDWQDGNWHFLAATYDGGAKRVYRDGKLLASTAASGAIGTSGSATAYIGSNAGGSEFFAGSMDELRILSTGLSPAQIAEDYERGYGAVPFVEYSTNAGVTWRLTARQSAPTPYLGFSPASNGTGSLVTLTGIAFDFVQSATLAADVTATNQVRFTAYDMAGNATVGGPFAVLVETAPANAVTDLAAANVSGAVQPTVRLTWTAKGGGGNYGLTLQAGSQYAVQYATGSGVGPSTAAAQVVIATAAVADGSAQSYQLSGLLASTTYYIRVFTRDWVGNWSAASNLVAIQTVPLPPVPDVFVTGENADLVLGQSGFLVGNANQGGGSANASGLYSPYGVEFDGAGNLWVADALNNRVLRYTPPFANGMNAGLELGQPSGFNAFITNGAATSQSGLNNPEGAAFDRSGNLWVADYGNNRVLMFARPFSNGMNASLVLGQAGYGTAAAGSGSGGMNGPARVALDDSGNVWVSDTSNHRVLRFTPPFFSGMNASLELGQVDFSGASANRGGAPAANTLNFPQLMDFDANGALWLADSANNRVLRYTPPFTNGMAADLELGQPAGVNAFTTNSPANSAAGMYVPNGVMFDGSGTLFVSERDSSRVTRFFPPFSNGMAAAAVLGQNDLTSSVFLGPSQNGMRGAVTSSLDSTGRLFVADRDNHRILRHPPTAFPSVLATTMTVQIGPNFNDPATSVFQAEIDTDPAYTNPAPTVSAYATSLSRQFTGLTPNTTYYARAKARNTGGLESSYGDFGSTITLANVPVPAATAFSVFFTSLTVSWLANLNPSGTLYHVQLAADGGFGGTLFDSALQSPLSFVFRGLQPGGTYYARVRAQNWAGTYTAYSDVVSTVTSAAPPAGFAANLRVQLSSGPFVLNTSTTNVASPTTALDYSESAGLKIGQQPLATSSNTVGHWRFDEGSGSSASDESPYRNHGTLGTGISWTASGRYSSALQRGVSQAYPYVTAVSSGFPTGSAAMTGEVWFKLTDNTGTPSLFMYGNESSNQGRILDVYKSGANSVVRWGFYANDLDATSSIGFHDGNWHFVAVTYDGSLQAAYVDGVLMGSRTAGAAATPSGTSFTIGNRTQFPFQPVIGAIDEVRILNRVLSADEVAADFYSGAQRYSTTGANGVYSYIVSPSSISLVAANGTAALVTSTVTAPALRQGTDNYVRHFAQDVAGQTWTSAAYQVPVDTTPPAAVADLAAANVSGSSVAVVSFTWTGTGSDGSALPLLPGSYIAVQASTYTAGLTWSTAAAQVFIATAVAPGTAQSLVLKGLSPDRPYSFRLWNIDNTENVSAPSNIATLNRTLANPATVGANFHSNPPADIVLGEPDFLTTTPVTAQNRLAAPYGLGVDAAGNVWVGEQSPSFRVVRFPAPHSVGMSADLLLGQALFTNTGAAAAPNRMNAVQSVAFDLQGNAYVMDWGNNRVLRFDPPFTDGMNASLAIGQQDFSAAASLLSQTGLVSPRDVVLDAAGSLWVADFGGNRVLQYRPPFGMGMPASLVLGQPGFSMGTGNTTQSGLRGPHGLAFDAAGNLWVADYANHRVLRFAAPFASAMDANLVLGQADFVSGTSNRGGAAAANTLSSPERLALDGDGNLWVADSGNSRLLKFAPPFSNGMSASAVIGQRDFSGGAVNQGGAARAFTLAFPASALPDALGAIWVADGANARVLRHLPQALTVTGPNSLQADIGANGNADSTLYEIQVSSVPALANTVASSGYGGLSATFSGLVPNSLYYGQARAKNGDGTQTPFTFLGSSRTYAAQPLALAVTLASNTQVSLSWNANLNPPDTVYEASLSTDVFTLHFATQVAFANGLTATATTHSSLAFGTSYYFRVRARNADLIPGAFSATASTETIPDRPTGLAGTVLGISSIAWTWGSAGGSATRYIVRTSTPVGSAAVLPAGFSILPTAYTETGLKPNLPYGVQVEAFDNSGSGGLTATVTHYTHAAAPSGLGRIGVSSITLGVAWNINGNPPYTRYEVSYSTDNFNQHVLTAYAFSVFQVSTAAITGLAAGTSYYVRVRAENDEPPGFGGPVVTAYSTLATQTLPGPVPFVEGAVLGVSSIAWSWASSGGGATQYRAYDAFTGILLANNLTITTFTQTGLSVNNHAALQVEAFSLAGSAGLSPETTHFTHANPPANLAPAQVSTSAATLRWSVNGNPPYTLYELSYSTDAFTFPAAVISTPVAFGDLNTVASALVSGLVPGPTYYFRVRAQNNETIFLDPGGPVQTAFSGTLKLQLPPSDVGEVSVQTLGVSSLSWTWSGSTNTGVNYIVQTASGGALLTQTATTYVQAGLQPNSAFGIRVQAESGGSFSAFTAPVTGYTFAAVPASLAPVAVTSGSVALAWGANANPGYTGFELEQSLDGFALDVTTPVPAGAGHTALGADIGGLAAGVTVYYKLRAFNQNGVPSDFTAAVSTQTLPRAPESLAGTVLGTSAITWTWAASGGNAQDLGRPVLYRLRRAASGAVLAQDLAPPLLEVTSGTTALWRLNEGAASSAADAAPGAHTLTLSNPAWVPGRQGYALRFDGVDDYAGTSGTQGFALLDYTLEAWVRTAGAGAGERRVVGQGDAWGLNLQNNRIAVCDSRELVGCLAKGVPLNDSQYHHLAVSRRDGVEYRFYVDGALVGIEPAGVRSAHNDLSDVRLGGNAASGQYFAGDIDEVRVLTRDLSDEEVANDGAGRLPYTESALTPDTAFGVTLEAYDRSGSAGLSAGVTRYTLAEPPAAVAATAVTSTTVTLAWSRAGNPTTTPFELSLSTDGFRDGAAVFVPFSAGYTATTTVAEGLEAGTSYAFRVRARNAEGVVTNYAAAVSTVTLPGGARALAGSALGVSSISWTWAAAPGTGNAYRVISASAATVLASALTDLSYTETGLSTNTAYGVLVQAYNAAGGGALLGPATVYTLAAAPAALALTAVTTSSVSAAWNASGNPPVTPYEVSLSTDGFATVFSTPVPFGSALTAAATTLSGLPVGAPLQLRVRAANGEGAVTEFSNVVSTLTLPGAVPPGTLQGVVRGTDGILWSWGAAAGAVANYRVRNATSTDILLETPATSFLQLGLRPNQTYGITVESYNGSGTGGTAGPLFKFTFAARPTNLSVAFVPALQLVGVTSTSVSLAWNENGNPFGTPFELSQSTDAFVTSFSTPVAFLQNRTTTYYTVSPLQTGTVYSYRVRARNADTPPTPTDFSAVVTTRTLALPGAITDLAASGGFSAGTVNLTWTSPGDNGNVGSIVGGAYRIDYSTDPAHVFGFETFQVEIATNTPAVRRQGYGLSALLSATTYYLRLFTRNGQGVWSGASNLATVYATGETVAFTVLSGASLDFGAVTIGSIKVGEFPTLLRNAGNTPMTFVLSGALTTPGTPWSLALSSSAARVENRAFLAGGFASAQPGPAEFDAFANSVSTTAFTASTMAYTLNGLLSGSDILPAPVPGGAQSRLLWYRVDMPSYTTTGAAQSLRITIIGTKP